MKIIFVGDLCVGDQFIPRINQEFQKMLSAAEIICVNLEGPILSAPMPRAENKAGPTIHQSAKVLPVLDEIGATHVNLANNHIMDFGMEGLTSTLRVLQNRRFFGAGANLSEAYRASLNETEMGVVALLAFGEAQFGVINDDDRPQGGYAWIDSPHARRAILEARKVARWVIVQVHAGLEMEELPLPEWRSRYREIVDLGADLVIGHHPHVLQGAECYKGKMIYYSIGNFYMASLFDDSPTQGGAALEVDLVGDQLLSKIRPLNILPEAISLDETDEAREYFLKLCDDLIHLETYLAKVNAFCVVHWRKTYSKYYAYALCGLGTEAKWSHFFQLARRVLSFIKNQKANRLANETLLIHNIRIESHRWAAERALTLRNFT